MEAKYKIVHKGPGFPWLVYAKDEHTYHLHGVRDSFAEARQLVYKMVEYANDKPQERLFDKFGSEITIEA